MSITFRSITVTELPTAIALWKNTPGMGINRADTIEALTRLLARNPGCSFVAFDGELLIGTALGSHDGRRGFIAHVAVLPKYRGKNIGTELIDRCLAALRCEGLDKCHVFVYTANSSGVAFWKKKGWQERTDLMLFAQQL